MNLAGEQQKYGHNKKMNETELICSFRWISLSIPFMYIIPRYVVMFTGFFANVFLVIGLIMDPLKCFRNSSSYLIMNLAVSDILVNLLWFLAQYVRPCVHGLSAHPVVYVPPYVGCTSIATMAFDRYMSCVHPFKYRILITRNVILTITFFQWSFSLGLAILEIIYAGGTWEIQRGGIFLFILLSAAIMYGKAACVLKNNSRYLKSLAGVSTIARNRSQQTRLVNEKRLFTTMFLVSFITIIMTGPLMIYVTVAAEKYMINEDLYISTIRIGGDPVHVWLGTLFFVNFSINPLMYIWRFRNYRETFKIILKNLGFCCF